MSASIDEAELHARVREVLCNWPVVGLAVGVIKNGSLAWFYGHGVADVESGTPIDQDTVFRIASVTKTMTAIATMQLRERGQVDLGAPASDYLRAYRLIPARAGFRPPTLRHLLTHTAGVRAVRKPSDLLRPALGWGVPAGQPIPTLAACTSIPSRERNGPTPITDSPHSARSSRTSAAFRLTATCGSTYSGRSA